MHDYKDNFNNAIDFAVKKTKLKWWKLIFLGIMGCIYVGIAYIAFITVVAGMQDSSVFAEGWQDRLILNNDAPKIDMSGWPLIIGAAVFPVGLLLIVFLGGSLFTSDNLTSIAILTKQIKIPPVVFKWSLTLLGNIIGAFIIAAIARGAHVFNEKHLFVLQQIIAKKVHMEWWHAFFSGILCNILVAGTVWSTMATKHSIAKIFLIYFPIWLFAIVGFQHVTANSIIFAFGWTHADSQLLQHVGQGVFDVPISLGDWSFRSFFINMLPAMIGNWLSGAIFLPFIYFWLSDNHLIVKTQKALQKQQEQLRKQRQTIENQQERIENQQETIENQQGFVQNVQKIINDSPNDFPILDELVEQVVTKKPWYKKNKANANKEQLHEDKFSLYEDELLQHEIPSYDELYTSQEDSIAADAIVKTDETDFSYKNKKDKN